MEQPARPVNHTAAFIDLADMPSGMPARQRLILTVLMRRESCDYAELADSTGMSRRSLSSHCKQLEADGYITREYRFGERGRVPCQIRLGDLTPRPPPRRAARLRYRKLPAAGRGRFPGIPFLRTDLSHLR